MRNVDEGMHEMTRVEWLAVDDFFNVAEFIDVQNDANGMTTKEDDDNAKQYHA